MLKTGFWGSYDIKYRVCQHCADEPDDKSVRTLHRLVSQTDYKSVSFGFIPLPSFTFYTLRIVCTCLECKKETMFYTRGICKLINLISEIEKFRR